MTTIDWIIVAFVALMAFWGYAQGLVVSALSLGGFAVGAFARQPARAAAARRRGRSSPYAPLFSLVTRADGGRAGGDPVRGARRGHRAAGCRSRGPTWWTGSAARCWSRTLGLGLVWIAGAVALQTPGASELRKDIQRSAILAQLNEVLPPSGPILNALARVDPFPRIRGPAADVPAPTARHPRATRTCGGARRAS